MHSCKQQRERVIVAPRTYRGTLYLTYKKMDLPRTLPWACAWGHRGVLGEWAFPYGRGISVDDNAHPPQDSQEDP